MKIKSLWISEYKNLKHIDLDFNDELINIMVGQNGLGKSNLMEILTTIFKDLDLISTEAELIQRSHFDYRIVYTLNDTIVKIELIDDSLSVKKNTNETEEEMSFAEFKRHRDSLLPRRIIGYYSGENRRLQETIDDYVRIEKNLQIRAQKRRLENKTFRRIFFAENFHSQLILLTLAIYEDKANIRNFLSSELKIESVDSFDITFSNPRNKRYSALRSRQNTVSNYRDRLFNSDSNHPEFNFWGLKGNVDKLLNVFFDYAYNEDKYYIDDDVRRAKHVKERLILEDISVNNIRGIVQEQFPNPIDFFDALESCSVLGVLDLIKLNIRKSDVDNILEYKGLSEGEQQMISVMGMMLITALEQNILYLLDEPDTHINPKWQRNYIKQLKDIVIGESSKQVFISTHSPLLVQAHEEGVKLLLFRSEDGNVKIDIESHTINNWKIGQVLMSEYFGLPSTRPESMDLVMEKRLAIIQKGELTEKDREELKNLENDLGFLPTGETILEIESMAYINKIAERFREEDNT